MQRFFRSARLIIKISNCLKLYINLLPKFRIEEYIKQLLIKTTNFLLNTI